MLIAGGFQPKSGASAPAETPRGGSGGSKRESIKYLGEVQRLALKPGDTLVVTAADRINSEQALRMKEYILSVVGPGYKVIVLDAGTKIGVLTPEE